MQGTVMNLRQILLQVSCASFLHTFLVQVSLSMCCQHDNLALLARLVGVCCCL